MNNQFYIGLLSGTSVDNIDAAIFDFKNSTHIELIETRSAFIPPALKAQTLALSQSGKTSLKEVGELDYQWGHLFSKSIQDLLSQAQISAEQIIAIGSHGQTIWHQPTGSAPFTMQIGDPNIIAKTTGIITISDFRRGDMALGGQGAPLIPAFHQIYFQSHDINRVIVNLGGIANISFLAANFSAPLIGYDTGPANSLLDSWCMIHQNQPYDHNGQWAQTGKIDTVLLNHLLSDPYFSLPYPKSTGKDYFNINWLNNYLKLSINHTMLSQPPENIQATLVELTAMTLSRAIQAISSIKNSHKTEIVLCGGGARNHYLVSRLQNHLGNDFILYNSDRLGIHSDWVEAACFSWLAKSNMENTSLDYTAITGASKPTVLGTRCLP